LVRELHWAGGQDHKEVCQTSLNVVQQTAPWYYTLSTGADVHGPQKVLSNNGYVLQFAFE